MERYGYIRVSSKDQNPDRQLLAMQEQKIKKHNIYLDQMSGKDFARPQYHRLLRKLHKGDIFIIKSIDRKEAFRLIEDGVITGGMIPKVKSAVEALNAGVRKVHFIDGRVAHTLLLEIFTPEGIGTEIVREQR